MKSDRADYTSWIAPSLLETVPTVTVTHSVGLWIIFPTSQGFCPKVNILNGQWCHHPDMMSLAAQSLCPQPHHTMTFNLSQCSDLSSSCFPRRIYWQIYIKNPKVSGPEPGIGAPKTSKIRSLPSRSLGFCGGEGQAHQSPCSSVRGRRNWGGGGFLKRSRSESMTVTVSAILTQCSCLCPPLLDLSVQSSPTKLETQGNLSRDLKEKQDCSRWRRGHSRLRQLLVGHLHGYDQ